MEGSQTKTPLRHHLEQVLIATGECAELENHGFEPPVLSFLWSQAMSFRAGTVNWQELKAYQEMMGVTNARWEVQVLIAIDLIRG